MAEKSPKLEESFDNEDTTPIQKDNNLINTDVATKITQINHDVVIDRANGGSDSVDKDNENSLEISENKADLKLADTDKENGESDPKKDILPKKDSIISDNPNAKIVENKIDKLPRPDFEALIRIAEYVYKGKDLLLEDKGKH